MTRPGAGEFLSLQTCAGCGRTYGELDPRSHCECGGLLEVRHRAPGVSGRDLKARFAERIARPGQVTASGVWRYSELVLPSAAAGDIITHPEGNTPLLEREALTRWAGLEWLRLKHEGHNPTGSFKDRGMTVGITQAKRVGATAVGCASTGNTAASLAAYAAQAAIPAVVMVPAGQIAMGKLAQALAYGARTLLVRGDFDRCLELIHEAESRLGLYLLNSVNPFRVEGQKTIVLEMLQQLDWQAPDWIVLPAGNLGNTAAFGKALAEARHFGLVERVPRLAAIQASGAAPFARGYAEGFARRHRLKAETIATAIRIGDPVSWDRAVRAIGETNGVVTTVTDGQILEAKALVDGIGVGCEPASAASLAGTRQLVQEGVIKARDRVVAVLTGHVLKDPGTLLELHKGEAVEIDANIRAVERVLRARC